MPVVKRRRQCRSGRSIPQFEYSFVTIGFDRYPFAIEPAGAVRSSAGR
jgi:hypothetical protein